MSGECRLHPPKADSRFLCPSINCHASRSKGWLSVGGGFLYTFLFPASPFVGTTEAQLTLNAEQIRGLIAGKYYVNIHTTSFLEGEISGHINLSRKNRYVTWHPSLVDDPRLTNGDTLGLRVTIVSLPEFV